jgi:hypothetical protein
MVYSYDGITWYSSTILLSSYISFIVGNPRIGPVVVDSQLSLNKSSYSATNQLDLISDKYINNGVTNMSVSFKSYDL